MSEYVFVASFVSAETNEEITKKLEINLVDVKDEKRVAWDFACTKALNIVKEMGEEWLFYKMEFLAC